MNYKTESGKGNEPAAQKQFTGLRTLSELFFWHYDNEEHLWEFANSLQHKSFCFRLYL